MNYELAKQLKEAGFPQVWPKPDFVELHDAIKISEIMAKYENGVYSPTLAELIEACGEHFGHLDRRDDNAFVAYPSPDKLRERKEWYLCRGTPEEAVARLWLALNSK